MTADEAAKVLGVSSRKVYDLAAPAGPIPCQRIGRTVRFQLDDIQEYSKRTMPTGAPEREISAWPAPDARIAPSWATFYPTVTALAAPSP